MTSAEVRILYKRWLKVIGCLVRASFFVRLFKKKKRKLVIHYHWVLANGLVRASFFTSVPFQKRKKKTCDSLPLSSRKCSHKHLQWESPCKFNLSIFSLKFNSQVWDLSGKCVESLRFKHNQPVLCVKIDQSCVLSSCAEGLVKMWSLETASLLKVSDPQ